MSQHNFDIANVARSLFRGEVNNGLKALATLSSGSTAPSTTYAFQLWMDTSSSPAILKVRDAANTTWVTLGPIADSTQWRAYTANTERMRIDSTGKVGIAKTNPAYALDVTGDINCTGSLRINGTAVGTIADGSITYAKIQNVSANAVLMRNVGTDGTVAAQVIPESALVGRGPGQTVGAVTLGTGLSMTGNVLNAAVGSSAGRLIGYQVFKASGTYTKATNNPSFVVVEVIGGGGSGARGGAYANGGGAGGKAIELIQATALSSSVTVTVGAGGASRSISGQDGQDGGTSSFGAYCSASGGAGGRYGASSSPVTAQAGGVGSGGDINLVGDSGGISFWGYSGSTETFKFAGAGGRGFLGSGGRQPFGDVSYSGNSNSGAGGSGSVSSANSGAGGSGCVIVWEYS